MDASIVVAIISGVCTVAAVIVSNLSSASKTKMQVQVLTEEIKSLNTKVDKHNGFDRRIVAIETRLNMMDNDGK